MEVEVASMVIVDRKQSAAKQNHPSVSDIIQLNSRSNSISVRMKNALLALCDWKPSANSNEFMAANENG